MLKSPETKNKIKAIIISLTIIGLIFSGTANFVTAKNSDVKQLNAEKAKREKKLEKLNTQIKKFQQQIVDTRSKSNTLKNEVFIYEKQIASTELQILARETQIEDTDLQIRELEKLIKKKQGEIDQDKEVMAKLIFELNELDKDLVLRTALSSNNLSNFLDEIQYTQNFQNEMLNLLQKIKTLKTKLENDQADLKVNLKNLEGFREQLKITKEVLTEQKKQKQILLTQTRGIESNFQKLLSASRKEGENIASEIEDLDRAIRKKLGVKTVPAKKGILAWPIDGILTQKYGNTGFRALGYDFHNGLDIAGPAGQPIYAAADGEVIYTDSSNAAYGNWVAIKHNISNNGGSSEIITLYAHLRSFKVAPGQKIKQGDLIAFEGNSGNTTRKLYGPSRGYHIHFGVYNSEGFGVKKGKYSNIYGHYKIPYGYTYNPLKFLR